MGILISNSVGFGSGAEQLFEARVPMEGAFLGGERKRFKDSVSAGGLTGEGDGDSEKIIA